MAAFQGREAYHDGDQKTGLRVAADRTTEHTLPSSSATPRTLPAVPGTVATTTEDDATTLAMILRMIDEGGGCFQDY